MIFASSMYINPFLESVSLNGNPLGASVNALVSMVATSVKPRKLELNNCSLVEICHDLDMRSPAGFYSLDLNVPYHFAMATILLSLASRTHATGTTFQNLTLNSEEFDGFSLASAEPWRSLPTSGLLEVASVLIARLIPAP